MQNIPFIWKILAELGSKSITSPIMVSFVTFIGFYLAYFIAKTVYHKDVKKSTHIFVFVEPKYNQDIFNFRLNTSVRISIFDVLYSAIFAGYYIRREENEKKSKLIKSR